MYPPRETREITEVHIMTLAQLLMTTAAKHTPLIALFCKSAPVSLTSYYEARMMATRLSKCNEPDNPVVHEAKADGRHLR